jgi:hypothetical protein
MDARGDIGLGQARTDEDPRALAARLVNAIYRLVKACQIHAENNAAVAQVVDFVVAAVKEYALRANFPQAAILFTTNAVFVNRQMLRASRETYQLALELGQILEPCGVTEVTLSVTTTPAEVAEFGRVVADFVREGKQSTRLTEGGWEGLRLRKVHGLTFSTNLSPPVKAARTYAAALMIVRGFYDQLRQGKYELRQGIKRVAQKLVSQNDAGGRLLLSIAAAPPADADRAGLALSSAIISLAMATQLTDDRTLLSALASAALLVDVGRPRLIGYEEEGGPRAVRRLNAEEEELVPTSSLVALAALGKFHPPNLTRAVVVHEALLLRDGGVPHAGKRQPSLMGRILATARAFAELRVPKGTAAPLAIDDALQVLEGQARDTTDRTLIKLLIGALGIFPAGTMVELSTGEMGVVLATPTLPVDFARPPVRVLYDSSAQLLEQPVDIDLAAPPKPGEPARYVKRPIDTTDQQMKQMRAYVVQLAANRARKNSVAKMRAVMAKGEAPPSSSASGSSPSGSSSWQGSSSGSNPSAQSPSGISRPSPSYAGGSNPGASSPGGSYPGQDLRTSQHDIPSAPRHAPTARPPTRQFDGRAVATPAQPPRAEESRRGVAAPSPDGSRPVAGSSTRALKWDEYGLEIVSAAGQLPQGASSADISDTDALLAAYLSDEAGLEGDKPPASSGPSSTGRQTQTPAQRPSSHDSSSPGYIPGESEARSFGLRWGGDRNSSPGRSVTGSSPFGSGRTTGERPVVSDRPSAQGFGGPGRATTGTAGLRIGSQNRDSRSFDHGPPSSGPASFSPPPHGGTKHGVGSTGGRPFEDSRSGPREQAEEGFSFEERPFEQAPVPAAPAVRQPLRGSMSSAAISATRPPQPARRPSASAIPAAVPEPQPSPPPAQAHEPPGGLPVSRRGKAGSMNWGAPRRDDKK